MHGPPGLRFMPSEPWASAEGAALGLGGAALTEGMVPHGQTTPSRARPAPLTLLSRCPGHVQTPPRTENSSTRAEYSIFKQMGLQEMPSTFEAKLRIPTGPAHLAPVSRVRGKPSSTSWQP